MFAFLLHTICYGTLCFICFSTFCLLAMGLYESIAPEETKTETEDAEVDLIKKIVEKNANDSEESGENTEENDVALTESL